MTQACSARGRTSPRQLAGTAAIVFLKDGQDRREKKNNLIFKKHMCVALLPCLTCSLGVQNVSEKYFAEVHQNNARQEDQKESSH